MRLLWSPVYMPRLIRSLDDLRPRETAQDIEEAAAYYASQ
jgi:hypothetical protein